MGILATCTVFGVAEWFIAHSHLRYIADAGYFIEQMSSHAEYGRSLYTQLEFAYGPLLFYPTILLHGVLHCSWLAAYFLTLMLDQSLGLVLLAYLLNELPIRGSDRRTGFVLLAVGAINPLLGLNYTLFRFITPFAVLLFATRTGSVWRMTLLLAAGEILLLGISPELGFAFLLATVAYAGLRVWINGLRWLLLITAPALGAVAFLLMVGRPYLRMLNSFSHGALNLPVAPYPHILVFLFALVWIVPRALGSAFRQNDPNTIRLVACFALGIAFLPAALGRCDPLHVFFNGAGILVLSLVGIRHQRRRLRASWLAALVVFILWEQWVNNTLYLDRTADTLRLALMPRIPAHLRDRLLISIDRHNSDLADRLRPTAADANYQLDLPTLQHLVGNAQVATPLEISPAVEDALKSSGHYRPEYYSFFVDVLNDRGEAAKIRELNQAEWALLPAEHEDPFLETPRNIDGVQGFAFPYRLRHPIPYDLGSDFSDNLDNHWTETQHFGPYILYRRQPSTAP